MEAGCYYRKESKGFCLHPKLTGDGFRIDDTLSSHWFCNVCSASTETPYVIPKIVGTANSIFSKKEKKKELRGTQTSVFAKQEESDAIEEDADKDDWQIVEEVIR